MQKNEKILQENGRRLSRVLRLQKIIALGMLLLPNYIYHHLIHSIMAMLTVLY